MSALRGLLWRQSKAKIAVARQKEYLPSENGRRRRVETEGVQVDTEAALRPLPQQVIIGRDLRALKGAEAGAAIMRAMT